MRYEREKKHVTAAQVRAHLRIDGSVEAGWISFMQGPLRAWHFFFRWMFGYGHRPGWSLYWTAGIIAFAYCLYGATYTAGMMAPNSDVILASNVWQDILGQTGVCLGEVTTNCIAPLAKWADDPTSTDYETFSPFLYAVDLFVPLDALGQETTWSPAKDRGALGWWAYWMRMPIQMSGWVIAAVGAAVVTGVIGRKDR